MCDDMNGSKRILLIALVVVVLVAAAYTFIRESGPRATLGGPIMGSRLPVTFSGSGTSKTPSQSLMGAYTITWSAVADSDAGCHLDARLRGHGRGGLGEVLVNETIEDAGRRTGQINVNALSGGGFYIDASLGCSWEFTFDPW